MIRHNKHDKSLMALTNTTKDERETITGTKNINGEP